MYFGFGADCHIGTACTANRIGKECWNVVGIIIMLMYKVIVSVIQL